MSKLKPEKIIVSKSKDVLKLIYKTKREITLTAEYLRVFSPSAEVRGHRSFDNILQVGKKNVVILDVKTVGLYAIQIVFDDGHDSGIYSWDYLVSLRENYDKNWNSYLRQLKNENKSRLPDIQILKIK